MRVYNSVHMSTLVCTHVYTLSLLGDGYMLGKYVLRCRCFYLRCMLLDRIALDL